MFKYTVTTLKKIEDLLKEAGYVVRYEKGNFTAGYCVLERKRVIVINRYYETEARINSLLEIMGRLGIDDEGMSEASKIFWGELQRQSIRA